MASAALPMPQGGGREGGAQPEAKEEKPDPSPPPPRSLADRVRDWLHAARQTLKYGVGAADVGWLSSRLVAARRAMESEDEPVPLFKDPLAEALVGPRVMRAARAQARAGRPAIDARSSAGGKTAAATTTTPRKGAVSRIAARTLWFDAEVLDGVAGVATSAVDVRLTPATTPTGTDRLRVAIAPRPHAPAAQVVCLGAGMDTRAWRLALPGVAWFEVDAAHVLAAKAAGLRRARAEAPAWDGAAGAVRCKAGTSTSKPPAFPLTVGSYAALAADLDAPGWGRGLVEKCGFDRTVPTVFIAEGLVMYLSAAGVDALLAEAASIAAPGSTLAVVAATEAAAAAARARSGGRGIMAAWTWGCPPDPRPVFEAGGAWAVQAVATRSDIARRWGLAWTEFPVAEAAPCGRGRAERESLFIVAVKK
jgi:O-methyltransferase involved in polyketide biosynthesis